MKIRNLYISFYCIYKNGSVIKYKSLTVQTSSVRLSFFYKENDIIVLLAALLFHLHHKFRYEHLRSNFQL